MHTLPSGQEHHFRERAFKSSFLVSFGIHVLIIIGAGSMTLFRMSGTIYAPSYTVDLVTLPPAPSAPPVKEAPAQKPAPAPPKKEAKPAEQKKAATKPVQPAVQEPQAPIKPAGGDEAARTERRRRIEELEKEARQLYESFTAEESATDSAAAVKTGPVTPARPPATTDAPAGGGTPSDLRFRAYYDRIWSEIRSSWVVPEGVTSTVSLVTVVGIRVAPDGEIEQFWIEKKSGNDYYDQSALRAIQKANPLPPLPEGLRDKPLEVGINFRYPE